MSRPRPVEIHPVFLGGPMHGESVPDREARRRAEVRAVEPEVVSADDIYSLSPFRLDACVRTEVLYRPEAFAWGPGYRQDQVLIWVDSRLCATGKTRLMRRLAHELEWAPIMIRFPL